MLNSQLYFTFPFLNDHLTAHFTVYHFIKRNSFQVVNVFTLLNKGNNDMKSNNMFAGVMDTFVAPTKAFNGLKEAKGWAWFAAVLLLASVISSQFAYYNAVDTEFLVAQQMETIEASGDLNPAELEQTEASIAQSAPMMAWFAAIGGSIAILVFSALFALYYYLISKQDPQCEQGYGDWYGFTLFTSLPTIFAGIGTLALVFSAATAQIPLSVMSFSSLNQLVFNLAPTDALYSLLEGLNIFTFWAIALAYFGLKSWTNFSSNKALVFALLPNVLIFGIWALIAVL